MHGLLLACSLFTGGLGMVDLWLALAMYLGAITALAYALKNPWGVTRGFKCRLRCHLFSTSVPFTFKERAGTTVEFPLRILWTIRTTIIS